MTTPVRIQQRIRQLEGQGLSHTRIARELGVSRTTVIKYVSRDYSPSPRGVSLWFCQSVWGCLLVAFSGAFRPVSGAVGVGPA